MLPMQTLPVYSLTIPSTGKKIKFNPWLVKQEKALLIAQQSEDKEVMVSTLKQVITSCVLDKIDIDSFSTFDMEYVFTQIRSKSVGEEVDLIFKCKYCDDPKAKLKVTFDISKIEVVTPENHTKKIQLFDNVGVMMKYPTIESINTIDKSGSDIDLIFKIIAECVDYIYDDEQIYHSSDMTSEDIDAFLSHLKSEQFVKLEEFFDTMPKMRHEVNYNCPVCGEKNTVVLEGMTSFF